MPYLKFSRDKRGYENFFLIEPPAGGRDQRGGKARPRLLFWFRTPPHVKVGRVPFSDDVRHMVEAQNPGLTFDWARIMSTPIPPPDADHWRERRRVEKAARRASREEEGAADLATAVDEAEAEPIATAQETTSTTDDADAILEALETRGDAEASAMEQIPAETAPATSDSQVAGAQEQRGRRRRRRRRRHGLQQAVVQPGGEPAAEATSIQENAAPPDETPPPDEV